MENLVSELRGIAQQMQMEYEPSGVQEVGRTIAKAADEIQKLAAALEAAKEGNCGEYRWLDDLVDEALGLPDSAGAK